MELPPPSSGSSTLQIISSSVSSSPALLHPTSTKCSSPAPSPAHSSPLLTCGNLLNSSADELLSGNSNFSSVSRPAFGLHASNLNWSEFGGRGSLGLSFLAAHSQFGTYPERWRPSEAHPRGAAAFVPLMSLNTAFASNLKGCNQPHLKSHTSGATGAVNGSSASSPTGNSAVNTTSFLIKGDKEKTEGDNNSGSQDMVLLHQTTIQKKTDKKPKKKAPDSSSMGGSHSFSDSSSDGEEVSSDPDDNEEEDNDVDEDDSEDSYSDEDIREETGKRLTQNTFGSIKKRPSDGNATQDRHCNTVPLTPLYHLQSTFHPAGPPQSKTQFPQSSRTAEAKDQQHISVIQATGSASSSSPVVQLQSESSPLLSRLSPNPISFSSSPKHNSFSFFPKPHARSLCSSSKPLSFSSLPKPLKLMASQKQREINFVMASPNWTGYEESNGRLLDGRLLHFNSLKLKQPIHPTDSVNQPVPLRPKGNNCDTNLFLSHHHHLNGMINSAVQEAPLALITKPCRQSSTLSNKPFLAAGSPPYPLPINLSTSTKEIPASSTSPPKYFASSTLSHKQSKTPFPKTLHPRKSLSKNRSFCKPLDLVRIIESDIHSSKDSDSIGDDEDQDDIEDEDSGSSLSESESNLESDSDTSEDDGKEQRETEVDNNEDKTCLTLVKAPLSIHKFSSNISTKQRLNQHLIEPPSLSRCLPASIVTSSRALSNHSTLSPSFTFTTLPGKRRRVTDERALQLPLEFGWQRETRIKTVAGRLQGEVTYFAPCGKKLRQYPEVMKYLLRNGITEISRDNFSFSTKVNVGVFYEARGEPEGLQWCLLAENEITPNIIAMDGRRSRCTKFGHQLIDNGAGNNQWEPHPPNISENITQDVSDAKLLRKLEAQEIARQAARIKMLKKLEKQAMVQASKQARKQQAIMAAEERRKKKEQMKILKQQEKIKRIQQIRMEKELRAQQILEAKRKKKEEAANAKVLEAEKRNKEKEIRKLQTVILKHQELERHRLDMERERRRQHMMLMKAVEARKKAEERERLKKEKKDEKRLNKERKLKLRKLELEKAKELKKPNEDMCLVDHKPLSELSQIPGLILPPSTFSDCLMLLQFLHNFGTVLRLNPNGHVLSLGDLQEGLLNIGDGMGKVQDLLVSMLSAAVCDPGILAGYKSKTALGDNLTHVDINRDNVSEILQIYMNAHSEQAEQAALALSLRTKAFQAHSPSQKASMLAFLVNELCCSKAVISEIDKNIDHMTNLRKDKWVVEGELRKLRSIHAKKTGKKEGSVGLEDIFANPTVRNKGKRKEGDSEEEEDDEEDSEDQGDDDDEEEEESGGKRARKAEICEEEDDNTRLASMEELEKLIEKTYKQQSQIRLKLFDSSQCLRSMTIGQDRYRRHYWLLPQCGGIFVEGMESSEGYEDIEKEKKRQGTVQVIKALGDYCELEETKKPVVCSPKQSTDGDSASQETQQNKDNLNLFLQKPGSFSKLSKLLEVAKVAQDSDKCSVEVCPASSYPSYCTAQTATSQLGPTDKTDSPVPSLLKGSPWITCSPQSILHDEQLSKMLLEQSYQWFSLFPRSPCDESSVTSGSGPLTSLSPLQTSSPNPSSSLSPNPPATASYSSPADINNKKSSAVHQVKSSIHQSTLTLCDVSSTATSPSRLSLPPLQDLASQDVEDKGNKVFFLENSNPVNKSETPEPLSDKAVCNTFLNAEVAKTQDYCSPQPIPEEMLSGWWRVSDMEELDRLVDALHTRGIREKVLQKQIQKHKEYMTQLYARSPGVIGMAELEKQEVSEETVESWCIEEQAMEVDIMMLQQVEDLERKVVSANLQVKGWMQPEPQSEREDLVYQEHKFLSSSAPEKKKKKRETSQEDSPGAVVRQPNNPLDIAVIRLAELERNIERNGEEVAPGMRLWHKALAEVRSSAQLALCIQQLHKSIAWKQSIVKVRCQFCQKGDNEELLLLCDGCDKGCHTYCQNPKITIVPEGDWFCSSCSAKGRAQSPHSRRQHNQTAGGGKKGSEVKRKGKQSSLGELIKEEAVSRNGVPKKVTKEFKRKRGDDSPPSSQAGYDSSDSCAKNAKMPKYDSTNGLGMCRVLLAELEAHQDAWPFLTPVNHKAVPGYKKVIKKPMDFSTIREKLINNQYSSLETFIFDVNLVFENCETFNEDDSDVGRAGHSMRSYFDKRWAELLK
ncbi:bromodomain adjacent to zinc finger domain protein 2B-like isoform X2 [Antennarius striatus]|uniref:bromodomain adjacent to zinc finger domain protein 2B-like isoform X2 n=1 Tax=Antennarius striatus TaxID=241820 RepID=UPI0035AE27DC